MTSWSHLQAFPFSAGKTHGLMKVAQNCSFTLTTGAGLQSRLRRLKNGVPQKLVLATLIFNICIYDLPVTIARKVSYADGWAIIHLKDIRGNFKSGYENYIFVPREMEAEV